MFIVLSLDPPACLAAKALQAGCITMTTEIHTISVQYLSVVPPCIKPQFAVIIRDNILSYGTKLCSGLCEYIALICDVSCKLNNSQVTISRRFRLRSSVIRECVLICSEEEEDGKSAIPVAPFDPLGRLHELVKASLAAHHSAVGPSRLTLLELFQDKEVPMLDLSDAQRRPIVPYIAMTLLAVSSVHCLRITAE